MSKIRHNIRVGDIVRVNSKSKHHCGFVGRIKYISEPQVLACMDVFCSHKRQLILKIEKFSRVSNKKAILLILVNA